MASVPVEKIRRWIYFAFLGLLLAGGCRSIGPKTIPIDSFNYNEHISRHEQEELLLNIVRLRYGEMPLFLNVNSMINQYTREGRINGGVNVLPGSSTQNANVGATLTERPTITYTPVQGQAFSQSMMTPVPPAAMMFLVQSGWSADRIIRLTTNSINGLDNDIYISRNRKVRDPEFKEIIQLFQQLHDARDMGLHVVREEGKKQVKLFFKEDLQDDSVRLAYDRLKTLLNLNPDSSEFSIRYGLIQESDLSISIQTNSILEILIKASNLIEVPPEDVENGITASTFVPADPPLISILSSKSKPGKTHVAVKMRGLWFYIPDNDLNSKTTFAIIQILMSLVEDGARSAGPLISIGN